MIAYVGEDVDKENMVHLHNGVLLSGEKQWYLEICMQMGEIRKNILGEVTQTQKD